MKIADPLIFMVYPWGNFKSSYNGQDIEYLLKKVRISGKFNVLPTACVIAWEMMTMIRFKSSGNSSVWPSACEISDRAVLRQS